MWKQGEARSQERFLHGLLFFNDWFSTVLADNETRSQAVAAASTILTTWIELHGDRVTSPPMAYHDETTAQRLITLIALRPLLRQEDSAQIDAQVSKLMASTAALLAQDDFHATGNNHGMFQDLALLYYAIMDADSAPTLRRTYFAKAMSRLKAYFSICFTSEGVHVENTPTYHLTVSRQVANVQKIALAAGHSDAGYYERLITSAERYATHALMPNAMYPPISDTTQLDIGRGSMTKVFTGPEFAFAASRGKHGREPATRVLVLPESGYAIYRSSWSDPNASYAFFSAAYNANYHKHSDDLSFFLRSGGVDLLSESGPYSYDYQDPFSKYAYSQFAHNSLIVDAQSLPRTDQKFDKVTLTCLDEQSDGFTVEGTNARYSDTVHRRTLEIRERSGIPYIDITDIISSSTSHSYELLWNLGTEVSVVLHGQGFELFHNERKVMDLIFSANVPTAVSVLEGVKTPRPKGWRFPKFGKAVPAKVVSVKFAGSEAKLHTQIRLQDFNYNDRGLASIGSEWQRHTDEVSLNYMFRPAKGDAGRKRMAVVFSAIAEQGDFTYNYKASVDDVDISALYILDDFGDQGAYYYSDHGSLAPFRSVQNLIKNVASRHGIKLADVVTVGSSKGGAAALIHGLALPAGRIIAGAPQTRIGSFVKDPHPNILEFMTGGTSVKDVACLDDIIIGLLSAMSDSTRISIVVGAKDHHLRHHVEPLLARMAEFEGPAPSVTIIPELTHKDIGPVYRFYLTANLEQWIRSSQEEALPYVLTSNREDRSIRLNVFAPAEVVLSFRLFKGSEVVNRRSYSTARKVLFTDLPPGKYRVRVFFRLPSESEATAFTTRWIDAG